MLGIAGWIYSDITIQNVSRTAVNDDIFAKFIFGSLVVLGFIQFTNAARSKQEKAMPVFHWGRVAGAVLLFALYSVLLQMAGFIIATVVFTLLFMLFLGERKWIYLIVAPLANAFVTYWLFSTLFRVVLP